jgi:hypothetical protein
MTSTFNSSLRTTTIEVQQTWNSYYPPFTTQPADGIVNGNDWDAIEFAYTPPGPNPPPGVLPGFMRYQYFGVTDGGTSAHLGWNPYTTPWDSTTRRPMIARAA